MAEVLPAEVAVLVRERPLENLAIPLVNYMLVAVAVEHTLASVEQAAQVAVAPGVKMQTILHPLLMAKQIQAVAVAEDLILLKRISIQMAVPESQSSAMQGRRHNGKKYGTY